MSFNWLRRKKLSVKHGEELLRQYCQINGFDQTKPWKENTYAKHWLAYRKRRNKVIVKNWVAYHLHRGNEKYSIWIDLVSKEIREVAR